MSIQELRHLLHPVSPEVFLGDYWERRPVHIPGPPDKFRHLFSRQAFDRAIARHKEAGILLRVSFDKEKGSKQVSPHLPICAAEVEDYLTRGASVCADPIDRGDPALATYAATIAKQLGYTGRFSVKAYLSAAGCGFNTHFDKGIATTLQIEGRKRWRFSAEPSVSFPASNAVLDADGRARYAGRLPSSVQAWEQVEGVDETCFEDVILEPGDLLCLPAGTWHQAKAVGYSLALNLSFQPLEFLPFLMAAIRPLLEASPDWRRSLPAVLDAGSVKELPADLAGFFAERLREVQALLAELDPAGPELTGAWRQALDGISYPGVSVANTPPPAEKPTTPPLPANSAASPPTPSVIEAEGSGARRAAQSAMPSLPGPSYSEKVTCTLCVSVLAKSIEWYESVLGFRAVYRADHLNWCELATATPGLSVGLSEVEKVVTGGATLTFGVTDLEASRRTMEALGVIFDGPTEVIHDYVSLAPFFDLDGNRLILAQEL